jgi:superfamily II DNA or RNA helicase
MTVAAVTGSGKTRVATEIIEDWLAQHPGGQVTVLVPGRALMRQWKGEFTRPVGRVGGGPIPGWSEKPDPHLNIATLQTMSRGKTDFIGTGPHLVVVDECHNLRGPKYRQAMDIRYDAALGLSATPHPDEEAKKVVTEKCGPILVRYRYAEALRDGVVPPFRLRAIQIPLTVAEQLQYNRMTKRISKAMRRADFGTKQERARAKEEAKRLARERKMLLNRCRSRFDTVRTLLDKHADQPTLLFHERTEDVDRLAEEMAHLSPAVYHSNRPDAAEQFRRFNDRETNHLFSCHAVREGFNAPFVEVAVMMSGPNAPLSRIQTLGRCLRGRTDRPNTIYFLYVPNTTDERGLANLIQEADIPASVIFHERLLEKVPMPKAAHPHDMRNSRGQWVCNWCDLLLHLDGSIDDGCWELGEEGAPSHFTTCSECGHTAPNCQGLACSHSEAA